MYVCFRDNLATFLKSTNYKYITYSVPSLEFGTLYPLKVMNALHYIEDQCILCLLLAILIQYSYSGADYSSNGVTEPITQPAVSQDQDQKSKTSELSATTSSPTISQSSITPTTPVKMNSKSKTSFMEKVSQRASALNMTRLSSELVLATGSSTLRYQYLQLTYLMVKIFFFFSKKKKISDLQNFDFQISQIRGAKSL